MKKNVSKKYSEVMALLPRLLTAGDAEDYVAGPTILGELRGNFGLKPVTQRKGLTVYDRQELDAAIEKLKLTRS